MLRIWVYANCYNEAYMMPHFLRHYSQFACKIIIYDQQSTDGTREVVSTCNRAELRDFTLFRGVDDYGFSSFADEQYKEARGKADWVFWVDCDEFVYHPDILTLLRRYKRTGIDVVRPKGFLMISDSPYYGTDLLVNCARLGIPDRMSSKPVVFRPEVGGMNFSTGKHECYPSEGSIFLKSVELKLLHYRYFGREYLIRRNHRQYMRLSVRNRQEGLGFQVGPGYQGEWGEDWYEEVAKVQRYDVLTRNH